MCSCSTSSWGSVDPSCWGILLSCACCMLVGTPAGSVCKTDTKDTLPIEPAQEVLDGPSIPRSPQSVEKKEQFLLVEKYAKPKEHPIHRAGGWMKMSFWRKAEDRFGNSRWPCTTRPSESRSGEPMENSLATESRRPLSGQNRNQNTCPRIIRRNGCLIQKNPPMWNGPLTEPHRGDLNADAGVGITSTSRTTWLARHR